MIILLSLTLNTGQSVRQPYSPEQQNFSIPLNFLLQGLTIFLSQPQTQP